MHLHLFRNTFYSMFKIKRLIINLYTHYINHSSSTETQQIYLRFFFAEKLISFSTTKYRISDSQMLNYALFNRTNNSVGKGRHSSKIEKIHKSRLRESLHSE